MYFAMFSFLEIFVTFYIFDAAPFSYAQSISLMSDTREKENKI